MAAAKTISDFAKKNKKFEFRFASLEGKFLDVDAVKELAKLPSKPRAACQGCWAP